LYVALFKETLACILQGLVVQQKEAKKGKKNIFKEAFLFLTFLDSLYNCDHFLQTTFL